MEEMESNSESSYAPYFPLTALARTQHPPLSCTSNFPILFCFLFWYVTINETSSKG